jgi:hypothetical protein
MKNVMSWIKGHLAIVICSAVIILSIPTAWYFSSSWNKKIREEQQAAAAAKYQQVEAAAKVTYILPRLSADTPEVQVSGAPNQTLTDWFKTHRERILAQAKGIVEEAERINRRSHAPLVEGLLPNATGQTQQVKALEMADKIVYTGTPDSVYPQLLERIGAGTPLSADSVGAVVDEERSRLVEQITAGIKRELTAEEKERVEKALVERRLAEYRARAGEISVYATMDAFPQASSMGSFVPRVRPNQPPPQQRCFEWQFDYWLNTDILDAIALANKGPDGRATGVDRSVVKRIDRIETSANWIESFNSGTSEDGSAAPSADGGSPDSLVEPKFTESISGRWSGPGNGVYDVRNVAITVVVSSARLPELIDAFARTNFMTVTDVDLAEVDQWADLEAGYFYGSEHVVRARLVVETIWLRSWTVPFMPKAIREFLSIPEETKPEGDAAATEGTPAEGQTPDGSGGR